MPFFQLCVYYVIPGPLSLFHTPRVLWMSVCIYLSEHDVTLVTLTHYILSVQLGNCCYIFVFLIVLGYLSMHISNPDFLLLNVKCSTLWTIKFGDGVSFHCKLFDFPSDHHRTGRVILQSHAVQLWSWLCSGVSLIMSCMVSTLVERNRKWICQIELNDDIMKEFGFLGEVRQGDAN